MRLTFRAALVALCGAACISEPSAVARAAYSHVPDGLWMVSGGLSAIIRHDVAQLRRAGDVLPSTVITTPSATLATLSGVAFDQSGTLWIAGIDDSLLVAFDQSALSSAGFRAATTVIKPVGGLLSAPGGIAFDRAQRLWVANHENRTLARFDASQLSGGGPQRATVLITGAGHPTALAFDASGTLWVSDNTAHTISGYSATQLESSGNHARAAAVDTRHLHAAHRICHAR